MPVRLRAFLTILLLGLALVACADDAPATAIPQGGNRLTPPAGVPTVAGLAGGAQTLGVGTKATLPDGQTIAVLADDFGNRPLESL